MRNAETWQAEVNIMAKSRQHQEAHGTGQIEKQLERQADAASYIQGASWLDREVSSAAEDHGAESREDGES